MSDALPPGGEPIGALHAVVLGVVEGLTEFLPISSTGHLIVANAWLGRSDPAMEVAIQAGAITAILVLYGRRLVRAVTTLATPRPDECNMLWLLAAGAAPAALLGFVLGDWIEAYLFDVRTVAWALIAGGVALWLLERLPRREERELERLSLRGALGIGVFQCLALVPGTSRSAATIAGGLVFGLSRPAAAEFSFLVGLPILYGAAALKLWQDGARLTGPLLHDFLIASVASFVTALAVVGPFVAFLRRHTFVPFAVYRIVFGVLLLVWAGACG